MSGDMYTSIGPVLIAVNPYEHLTLGGKGIYTSGVRDYYHRKVAAMTRTQLFFHMKSKLRGFSSVCGTWYSLRTYPPLIVFG